MGFFQEGKSAEWKIYSVPAGRGEGQWLPMRPYLSFLTAPSHARTHIVDVDSVQAIKFRYIHANLCHPADSGVYHKYRYLSGAHLRNSSECRRPSVSRCVFDGRISTSWNLVKDEASYLLVLPLCVVITGTVLNMCFK